jgi:ferric-dicitrate binding protein FerR (iron transport regulator)
MSGTTFVVSKGFGKDGRDVDIDGEAMFFVKGADVRGAGGKPFVVHTGNLVIEVLDTTGAGGLGAGGSARSGAGGPGAVTGGWGARFAVDAVRKRAGEEADVLDGKLRVMKSYHSDTDNEPEELGAGDMVMINREIDLMEKEKMSGPEEDKVKEKYHIVGQ